ncbi:hypothetical protein KR059_011494 [Drosophila kikkawai]|nr:hypothetical protein KR059_011494 [Drosophila kikkawai]
MNKTQKTSTKVKRGKQRQTTHTTGTHHSPRHTHAKARQNLVEAEMEKSRRAVEHKLISLSGPNQAIVLPRPGKRATKGTASGAGVGDAATVGGGGGASVQRRRQGKKQEATKPHLLVSDEMPEQEKLYKVESRTRGGYNVLLESPRRNGLTPRDFAAEAELAALMAAAQRSGTGGSNSKLGYRMHEKTGDGDAEDIGHLMPLSAYGQLGVLPRYKCTECGARFHVRSLLGAHRRTHEDDFKVRFCNRCPKGSSTTLTTSNQCKFCDRKFDLVRTLHIHQLTHCKKIPPQLRRKLCYTELAHEKKAPLPSFQRSGHHSQPSQDSHHSHRSQHRQQSKPSIATHQYPLREQPEEMTKAIFRSSALHERWR